MRPADVEDLTRRPAFMRHRKPLWLLYIALPLALAALWLYQRDKAAIEGRRDRLAAELAQLKPLRERADHMKRFARARLDELKAGPLPVRRSNLLTLKSLRETQGLQLASSRELLGEVVLDKLKVEPAITPAADITRCLGIAPTPLGRFVDLSKLISSPWEAALEQASQEIEIRRFEDEFRRLSERDLPEAAELLKARYLMVILAPPTVPPAGEPAHAEVYVWDFDQAEPLLAQQLEAEPLKFVTVPIARVPGAETPAEARAGHRAGARACALAAEVRELL